MLIMRPDWELEETHILSLVRLWPSAAASCGYQTVGSEFAFPPADDPPIIHGISRLRSTNNADASWAEIDGHKALYNDINPLRMLARFGSVRTT